MKIVSIPRWYPTNEDINSGIFISVQNKIFSKNHDVSVIYVEMPNIIKYFKEKKWKVKPIDKNVYYFNIPRLIPKVAFFQTYTHYIISKIFFKKYIRFFGKPDIIHAHVGIIAGETAIKLGKKYNIPVIVTEHHSALINNDYLLKRELKVIEGSDKFICVSNFLKSQLNQPNIIVIPNFIENPKKNMNSYKNEKFTIVTVTNYTKNKNTLLAVKAIQALSQNVELLIIGDGPERNQIINYCLNNNLKNIQFIGKVSNYEVKRLISNADLLLSTSYIETFGVSILEAISFGIPVITTDSGGVRDIVNSINGLILESTEPSELSNAILKVINKDVIFSKLSILNDFNRRFSEKTVLMKYEEIFNEITRRNK